jgi:hypothetical protein
MIMHRYRTYHIWFSNGEHFGEYAFTPYQVKKAFPYARIEKGHIYL